MRASQENDREKRDDANHRSGDKECDESEQGSFHVCATAWFAA